MDKNLNQFEKKIGIRFKDKNLLRQVFVHRSYLNENVGFDLDHNERLEFLGDAVLELIVTHYLYRHYKNPEGELTNWRSALVKGPSLSQIAKDLGMDDYLYLSHGEQQSSGKARELIRANTLEALIGGIFLDQGYEMARKFVEKVLVKKYIVGIIKNKLYMDPKSNLQQLVQEQKKMTPQYKVMAEYGPDHEKSFTVGAFVGGKLLGEGSGSSKQAAEQAAANSALENFFVR
jgi:ribonuclease-3